MRTLMPCTRGLIGILALLLGACSPDQILGSNTLPPDVPDPAQVKTPDGALAAYRGALLAFGQAFGGDGGVILSAALLTDELQDGDIGLAGAVTQGMYTDARTLREYSDPVSERSVDNGYALSYGSLQHARGQIQEARGALASYAPDAPVSLRGRLLAFEGYTEIFLADLFCSGVPLSTLDFGGDYTYQPGSPTRDVYSRAVAHFDSALALAADSAGVMNLARVGKGRALLALGKFAEAAQSVAVVPSDFRYEIRYYRPSGIHNYTSTNFASGLSGRVLNGVWTGGATMTDREGINGLPYLSSGDPRTRGVFVAANLYGVPHYVPAKYAMTGDSPIVLSGGVEARLIQAEAQLDAGDPNWLATLNALRTDGGYDTQPNAADSTRTDTLWHAGTGGVAGLAPLEDPGAAGARVDLVFRERGFWLFLTGHRQGDLRRLVRNYGRSREQVYPTGVYPGLNGRYGGDVNAPIPADERLFNPYFNGCLNREA